MRELLLACLIATAALAQADHSSAFTNSADIGAPSIKGSVAFDPATGQYRITGSGADIWGRSDQFHYLWREISGNFTITATARFLTGGIAHRKAVIMLRKTTDADSPYLQLAIHGDGMPAVQFRNSPGDTTNTVDFPIEGPGVWQLRLTRQGGAVTFWAGKDGALMRELGHTNSQLGSPVLLGLGVSSHTNDAVNTVLFSDVSIDQPPAKSGASK